MEAESIHPRAKAALDRQRKLGLFPLHEHNIHVLRLLERLTAWWQNRDPPAVGRVRERTIPGPDGERSIRIYRPEGDGPFPTVVFFHGGGYVMGGLASHDLFCRHLTRESGCIVVAVDYRLAPEHPFPAAVEDASAATEWATENPAELASTGQVAVAGDSAGGALAAIVSLLAAERDGPDIDYQALIYPGIGVEEDQPSVENHSGIVLSKADLEWFQDCYFGSEIHRRNPYADPSNASDLSGVAPATVVTAGFDPLRDGGRAYAEQLVADGVSVRYENYDAMIHGFATMLSAPELDRAHDLIRDIADDLRDAFER